MPDKQKGNVTAAKGRPMLTWVGKKPLSHVTAFPSQHVGTHDAFGIHGIPSHDPKPATRQSVSAVRRTEADPPSAIEIYSEPSALMHLLHTGTIRKAMHER